MFFLLFGKQTFAQVKKYKEGIQYHVSLEGIQEIQGKDKKIREGIRSSYIQGKGYIREGIRSSYREGYIQEGIKR